MKSKLSEKIKDAMMEFNHHGETTFNTMTSKPEHRVDETFIDDDDCCLESDAGDEKNQILD